jgi:hypothetical protein
MNSMGPQQNAKTRTRMISEIVLESMVISPRYEPFVFTKKAFVEDMSHKSSSQCCRSTRIDPNYQNHGCHPGPRGVS